MLAVVVRAVRIVVLLAAVLGGSTAFAEPAEPTILYLNRHGGTYQPGHNDSSANTTTIARRTGTIPPSHFSDAAWQLVAACVERAFSPWNIEITEEDPGARVHLEAVIGGFPQDIGLEESGGPRYGGVAIATCTPVPNAIVFAFSGRYGGPVGHGQLCATILQEVGHALGLDHAMRCDDPMTYLPACAVQRFQDVDAPCGEHEARECRCGGTTQNSAKHLDHVLGRVPDEGGCSTASTGRSGGVAAVLIAVAALVSGRRGPGRRTRGSRSRGS